MSTVSTPSTETGAKIPSGKRLVIRLETPCRFNQNDRAFQKGGGFLRWKNEKENISFATFQFF